MGRAWTAGPLGRLPRSALTMVLLVTAIVASSCSVGPSRRPDVATSGGTVIPRTSSTAPTTMPTGPGGPGRTSDPITWFQCPPSSAGDGSAGDSAEAAFAIACGRVTVPVSYKDSAQGTMQLKVARAVSPAAGSDAPPLVAVLGDPGQNGASTVGAVAASLPAEIVDHYVILTLDVRGTGDSNGFDCVSDATKRSILGMAADPSTKDGTQQIDAIARQLTFDCGDLVGATLSQYNSTNAADDLDTIRAALGRSTLSFVGRGFGATLGAVYADRYPGRVDRLVLDSPRDPLATDEHLASTRAAAAAALLKDFAAACQQFSGGCPLGDDPAAAVTTIVHGLSSSGQRSGAWIVTGGTVLMALLELLPDHHAWPKLAEAIAALRDGDGSELIEMLHDALGGADSTVRLTGRLLYQCNDSATRLTGSSLQHAVSTASSSSPLFGPFTVAIPALCSAWPAPEETLGRVTAAGAPPILVIGSVNNPRHPYAGVQSVANQLSSAVLVTWQSGADGSYPTNACVSSAVDTYLLDATAPDMGILCPP